MNVFARLFDSSGFMPHGQDFIWKPILLWSFALSDALIAASYFSISFALWYFARRREDLPFKGLFDVFGIFIMASGMAHLVAIWTIWQPSYWFDASVKIIAAAVSAASATMLWLTMPRALAMLGRGELAIANQKLLFEIEQRKQAEIKYQEVNDHLEEIISQRTSEVNFKNAILSTQLEVSPEAILLVDEQAKILNVNRKFIDLWGVPEELVNEGNDEPVLLVGLKSLENPDEALARIRSLYAHKTERGHDELKLKDGRVIDRDSAPVAGANGLYYGRVWYFRDVTEIKRSEQALQNVNRALKALSSGNSALIHASNEAKLLQDMCRVIVDVAGYHLAWVGFAEHDLTKSVRIMARAGYEEGYLEQASVTWADNEQGMGPAGTAIRTQKPCIIQDAMVDPAYALWRDNAVKMGYGSVAAFPLQAFDEVLGVICIYSPTTGGFESEEIRTLTNLADDLAFGIATIRTSELQRLSAEHLMNTMEGTISAMGSIVEMRDPYTAGHQTRVSELSAAIATDMGLTANEVHGIQLAATIHDLGKIKVPAEILANPSKLSDAEFLLIKGHTQAGYDVLKGIDFPWPIAEIVLQHHERNDGSGYPRGLKESEIAIGAKILAVADTVEAMASHRPYRPALGVDKALEQIIKFRGQYYDARAVDSCVKLFKSGGFVF